MVNDELELLQLFVNENPKQPIPIVLVLSGRLLSGELVSRHSYQAALRGMPHTEQLVTIDGRSDGHVYLASPATKQVLKIDISAVQGFGPGKPSVLPPTSIPKL